MLLIFDTETTGLPQRYNAPLNDFGNWPRVVQLAWQLHDETGALIEHHSEIIIPEGFEIPFAASKIHHITTDWALNNGKSLKTVLDRFSKALNRANFYAGHNIEFDRKVLGAEFLRLGLDDLFDQKVFVDTKSEATTAFCALPGGKGGKFKWPSLLELHTKLFGQAFSEAHNAAFDVDANAKVFFALIERGIIAKELPEFWMQPNSIAYRAPDLTGLAIPKPVGKLEAVSKLETHGGASRVYPYVALHNHSQFSVLQSVSSIQDLVQKAADHKMPAIALTDHGHMLGVFLFWQTVEKHNEKVRKHNAKQKENDPAAQYRAPIKPILGCEFNVCALHNDKSRQDNGYPLPLVALNKTGYQNLCTLSSTACTEGMYYVPRIDKILLEQHHEGLLCFTGSIQSELSQTLLNFGKDRAETLFKWYLKVFGDRLYIEINRHGLEEEVQVNSILMEWSKRYGVTCFAATSTYYTDSDHARSRDILIGVKESLSFTNDQELNQLKQNNRLGRLFLPNGNYFFKSPQQMSQLFEDLPELLENTIKIADRIELFSLSREVVLPKFDIPAEFVDARDLKPEDEGKGKRGENAYLKFLAYKGAEHRYTQITPDLKERIDFELSVMERMGYPGYFLIVSDFTSKAREMGVSVGPGRGSAAGSVVAYCLGITNVDPIKYGLLFERFLNPDRISMPDIDIDFDDEGRDRVIDYVVEKYGKQQVAQIITYGTMGGKSAIRDTARVLNLPLSEADKLAKSFPDSLEAELKALLKPEGIDSEYIEKIKDRKDLMEQSKRFRALSEGNTPEARVLNEAYRLEGCVRNTGVHACGIIITPGPLHQFVPVTRAKDSNILLTQYDNAVAESAGLLKMDFLGLRTLTIIKDAVRLIHEKHGIRIDMDAVNLEDVKTYELFQRGETAGIFQFESQGMRKYLMELKPDHFTDLIAMNALYRPGPMAYIPNYINRKHGREPIQYDLPGMEAFLSETFGITVYQEQVMLLSQSLAGFTKGDADTLRKAMGKKQLDVLMKMKTRFLEGCKKNQLNLEVCEKVWKDWEAFASYAFNKSHSTCYAFLAFQTAYLKTHYPSEFMAACLNHSGNIEKITFFMDECRRMGIRVLGPDVNTGTASFSVMNDGSIRFGMSSIKGVGSAVVESLVKERKQNGFFKSVFDVAARLDTKIINKKTLENLALAGAFDSFEGVHRALFFLPDKDGLNLTDKLIRYAQQQKKQSGLSDLFADSDETLFSEPELPQITAWPVLEQLHREKEVVGVYISGHPLDPYRMVMQYRCNTNTAELKSELETLRNKDLIFAGVITQAENRTGKSGKAFGKFTVEDFFSSIDLTLFGKDFIQFNNYMVQGLFVFIRAYVQEQYHQPGKYELKIRSLELLDEVQKQAFSALRLQIPFQQVDEAFIQHIQKLCKRFPGTSALEIFLTDIEQRQTLRLFSRKYRIGIEEALVQDLKHIPQCAVNLI